MTGMEAALMRSVLIVPGVDPARIAKAAAAPADAVCIDLEDAVPPAGKDAARANAVAALARLDFGAKRREVRINGLDTAFAWRDVIALVEGAGAGLDALVVPKVNGRDELRTLDMLLSGMEAALGLSRPVGLVALIESAAGLMNIRDVVAATPRLQALVFGSGDYAASMQMPLQTIGGFDAHDALYPGHRFHQAMHTIVAAARSAGLAAIDGPFADVRDAAGLERAARIGRAMGFEGKWCIHPGQVAEANAVFAPAAEEVAWAEEVMAALAAAGASGRGAVAVRGKMIDAANERQCRIILARARAVAARDGTNAGGG